MPAYAIGLPGKQAHWITALVPPVAPVLAEGEVAIEWTGTDRPRSFINNDGSEVVPYVATAADQRAARKADANTYRDLRQRSGLVIPGVGRLDTDPERSIPLITGAASGAGIALALKLPYPDKVWTLADNTPITLTAQQLVQVGMAVTAFLDACQQACVAVKALLDAATTAEAIAAVDITAGYPAL